MMMKNLVKLLTIISVLLMFHAAGAQQFTLVRNGKSGVVIIIPVKATAVEIRAAEAFRDYIQQISGARLPVETDDTAGQYGEVLIGNVKRSELKDVPYDELGEDGLFIENTNDKLLITGGKGKGVLYGVYTFLEKYLGCRKYSPRVTYVPKRRTIVLHAIKDLEIPAFTYRGDFFFDAFSDREYRDWHKLETSPFGSDTDNEWGLFVHTFNRLLSPRQYSKAHPEYFNFYNGERHADQPCLTNPDVLAVICKNLRTRIRQNTHASFWSVSQNDNANFCRDDSCMALYKKHFPGYFPLSLHTDEFYSTHGIKYPPVGMGTLLPFINKVADTFPNKIISTLAYQWTRKPPRALRPHKNVNIMLSDIESPRNVPFYLGDKDFVDDLSGWAGLTHNIILWDYVVQYSNYFSPFPNLYTLQPNLQYIRDKGVSMVFEEGNAEHGGEFAALRSYMLAKLLWNPDIDFDRVMDDFLKGYYGKAAPMIRRYIDLLHESLKRSGGGLSIYGTPPQEKETFLTDSLMKVYNRLFDQAEDAVSGSSSILRRVKIARLPVYFAMLEIARDEKTGERGAFILTAGNRLKPRPEIVNMLHEFVYQCMKDGVSHIREFRTTPLEYLSSYTEYLEKNSGLRYDPRGGGK